MIKEIQVLGYDKHGLQLLSDTKEHGQGFYKEAPTQAWLESHDGGRAEQWDILIPVAGKLFPKQIRIVNEKHCR